MLVSERRGGFVYIMANKRLTVMYVGVTSNLKTRVLQHKEHHYRGSFSDRYNVGMLIYYESFSSIVDAIRREKQIKKWRREKKAALVREKNPEWKDLWDEIKGW